MITKVGSGIAALLLGWLGVLAVTMALSGAASAALVLFPSEAFLSALPDHVAISDRFAHAITLVSTQPGYVASLYESGARLVLPAGLVGCSGAS